jgi:hypothetical protein
MTRRRASGCALSPAMAQLAPQLLAGAQSLDPAFRITSACRTRAAQTALYAAYLRGESVLPVAPPGRSLHELGLAVDISRGRDPYSDELLAALGQWWTSAGLGWSPTDPVHFQLPAIASSGRPSATAALAVDPGANGMLSGPPPGEMPAGAMAVSQPPTVDPVQRMAALLSNPKAIASVLSAAGVSGASIASAAAAAAPFAIAAGAIGIPIAALTMGKSEAQLLAEATAEGQRQLNEAGMLGNLTSLGEVPVFKRGQRGPVMAGDPGIHWKTVHRIAKHLCRVLAAFD